jgi:hypothetical protein
MFLTASELHNRETRIYRKTPGANRLTVSIHTLKREVAGRHINTALGIGRPLKRLNILRNAYISVGNKKRNGEGSYE